VRACDCSAKGQGTGQVFPGDPRGGWVWVGRVRGQKRTRARARFFGRFFLVVSLNSHRCKAPENAIKPKGVEEKLTSKFVSIFLEKVFDMDFLQLTKIFLMVFLNSLYRETPKNVLKKKGKKKRLVGGSGI
jgi:hypothetical protein